MRISILAAVALTALAPAAASAQTAWADSRAAEWDEGFGGSAYADMEAAERRWEAAQRRFDEERDAFDQERLAYDQARERFERERAREEERLAAYDGPVWDGPNGERQCRRPDGTTGTIVGGVAGGLLGRAIDGGRRRTVGTLIGAGVGALLGRGIERGAEGTCR